VEQRKKFHEDWNPRLIFRDLERINPDFYPIPIVRGDSAKPNAKHYEELKGRLSDKGRLRERLHKVRRGITRTKYLRRGNGHSRIAEGVPGLGQQDHGPVEYASDASD